MLYVTNVQLHGELKVQLRRDSVRQQLHCEAEGGLLDVVLLHKGESEKIKIKNHSLGFDWVSLFTWIKCEQQKTFCGVVF